MFLIEDKNFLNKEQKNHIENVIMGNNFPWYINNTITRDYKNFSTNIKFLSHCILKRREEREPGEVYNSNESEFALSVLNSFCKKNKIEVNEVLRISINLTYNNGFEKCDVHEDHEYDHKQLLVYLNDTDKKLYTVIKDNKKEVVIAPEKYKGICFESKPHYHYFPKKNIRVVLIITFK